MAEDHTLDLVEEEIRRAEALLARDLISNDERRFIIPCLSESTKAILTLCCCADHFCAATSFTCEEYPLALALTCLHPVLRAGR